MKPDIDYSIYLVTDRELMTAPDLESAVKSAVAGGCTLVQLREKSASSLEFYEYARRIKDITDRLGVPLIINDRLDIALAIDAAGVHVGQSDLPAHAAREFIGPDKILGVSASSLAEALAAESAGADYLGVGAMFVTGTKTDADITTMEELVRIRNKTELPIVVIGGINKKTIPLFKGIGIDGAAVVSAILAQPDIEAAAREIKEAFSLMKNSKAQ